jgi:uncharacterized protein YktA (UPF0223 family)
MEYTYPLSLDWSKQEVIDVIAFFQAVEQAYGKGVTKRELMDKYKRFKEIVPGKAEEKQMCNEFEKDAGYSSYRAIQKAKELADDNKVKM